MEFPVVRRRHLNICRAEAVGTRIPCGVDRHETGPPASSDGVPDGQMMQAVLGESDPIHGCLVSVLDRCEQTP